jgi:hypothetical protein
MEAMDRDLQVAEGIKHAERTSTSKTYERQLEQTAANLSNDQVEQHHRVSNHCKTDSGRQNKFRRTWHSKPHTSLKP